jgi:ecotin
MKRLVSILLLGLTLTQGTASGAEHPELKAFPAAAPGMERLVIVLPRKERGEEDAFSVELFVGRMMPTDGVNRARLASRIAPRTLMGWGYTYYEVTGPSQVMTTLMAPPPGTAMVERLVTGAPLQVPYNSRLPIVIYAPEGYQIHYRIWQASKVMHQAEKG